MEKHLETGSNPPRPRSERPDPTPEPPSGLTQIERLKLLCDVILANARLEAENAKLAAENVRLNQMLGQEAQARKAAEAELNRYRNAEDMKAWNERITAQIADALGLPEGTDVLEAVKDLAAKVKG